MTPSLPDQGSSCPSQPGWGLPSNRCIVSDLPSRGGTTGASSGGAFLAWAAARPRVRAVTNSAMRCMESIRKGRVRGDHTRLAGRIRQLLLTYDHLVEQRVGLLAHFGRKVVAARGVLNSQSLGMTVQLEHRPGGGGDPVHAVGPKVRVLCGSNDQDVSRGQGPDQFVEVERDVGQSALVIRELWHVTGLTPPLLWQPVCFLAVVVVEKRVEPATRHNRLDAVVKYGGEDRIVSAERVADRPETLAGVYKRKGFEQVEAAHVVPDGLQGPALPAK